MEFLATNIHDAVDLEDSDDPSEQSDLGSDDGYIETESSGEEMEMEKEVEVADDCASHTYVPPHLREEKKSRNKERLRKTVQGLINR